MGWGAVTWDEGVAWVLAVCRQGRGSEATGQASVGLTCRKNCDTSISSVHIFFVSTILINL